MSIFPSYVGTRPRLAVEFRPEGIVAARAEEGSSLLCAVSRVELGPATVLPQHSPGASGHSAGTEGNPPLSAAERGVLIAALKSALEALGGGGRDITLIVPDTSVRVLLLDFDALPAKPSEALPIVRFRLKKLLPFEVETAAVSYQVLSSTRGAIRLLVIAMPGDLLAEFEAIVRDAGFEPGAVLSSTLAAAAGLQSGSDPVLLVNADQRWVTTAIVRGDTLLLHRSVDLRPTSAGQVDAAAEPTVATPAGQLDTYGVERELAATESEWELAQAISVATAYYEDTLERTPVELMSSGSISAGVLDSMLQQAGIGPVTVSEAVGASAFTAEATPSKRIPPGWLAGVRGALVS